MEVKETVTHINSPSLETFQSATLNINSPASPFATWSFELQLNEIDAALQVIDPIKFPIQKRNPPTPLILDLSPFIAISMANHSTLPIWIGNLPSPLFSASSPTITPSIASHETHDKQETIRFSSYPPKPRWTKVDRSNQTDCNPSVHATLSHGKRTLMLRDDHFELPNKHLQVSRSEEDDSIELVEADIHPRQSQWIA